MSIVKIARLLWGRSLSIHNTTLKVFRPLTQCSLSNSYCQPLPWTKHRCTSSPKWEFQPRYHTPVLRFVSIKHLQLVLPSVPQHTHQTCFLLVPRECATESPNQKPGNHPNYLPVPHPPAHMSFPSQILPILHLQCLFESAPSSSTPQSQTWVSPSSVSLLALLNSLTHLLPDPNQSHFLQTILKEAVSYLSEAQSWFSPL